MKFYVLLLVLLNSLSLIAAERAVIQQMKGRRAVVQFEKDIPFSVGQKIFLNSENGSEYGVRNDVRNPMERKNSVSLTATLRNYDTSPNTTTIYDMSGRYGWNFERYELGPIGTYQLQKVGSSEISLLAGGAFFDFNMIPNKPGEDFIWGGYGEALFGSASSLGVDSTRSTFTGGAFVKWFIFSPLLAVRANAAYSFYMQDKTNSSSTKKTYSSTGLEFGLSHYF